MKKLTPMSAPPDTAPKGQEVRAFVSYPVMKAINVPVEDPPRPVAQSTQAMPTVAPGTQAAALAAAVATIEPPQHQQPQSIKKTLAYPTIKVGQRSEPAVGSPPAVSKRRQSQCARRSLQLTSDGNDCWETVLGQAKRRQHGGQTGDSQAGGWPESEERLREHRRHDH
jgi:hypothetical protein